MPKDKVAQVKKPKSKSAKKILVKYNYAAKPDKAFTMKKSWHGVLIQLEFNSIKNNALLDKFMDSFYSRFQEYVPSPFIYDRPVTNSHFINRQSEIDWILNEIEDNSLVILYGAGGFGKTSVALRLREELQKKDEVVVGYVSFRNVTSEWDLIKRYVEAMFSAIGIPDYRWGFINESNYEDQFEDNYYKRPTDYAKRLGKRLIAIVDDFEAVYSLPHAEIIEAKIRSVWQPEGPDRLHIRTVVLQDLTYETLTLKARRRPLAEVGSKLFFDRIPPELWIEYIQKNFAIAGKSINESSILFLINKLNSMPRRIQTICHNICLTKAKVINRQLIDKTISQFLEKISWIYEARLGFLSKVQQTTLFSYADGVEIELPPSKHSEIFQCMDEFVYYFKGERVFRDPILKAYLIKRNNSHKKQISKKSGKANVKKQRK